MNTYTIEFSRSRGHESHHIDVVAHNEQQAVKKGRRELGKQGLSSVSTMKPINITVK